MKIPKKIVDGAPSQNPGHLSVVTFKKTDRERAVKKGDIGTVVSLDSFQTSGYSVLTQGGEEHDFKRHEFRLSTDEDVARYQVAYARLEARKELKKSGEKSPPEMPEMPDWMK